MRLLNIVFFLLFSIHAFAVPVPESAKGNRITDTSSTLTSKQIGDLAALSEQIEKKNDAVVLTIVLPKLDGQPIEEFSIDAAETLKPGRHTDRAAILVIALAEHKIRLEVSRELGTTLTDVAAKQVTSAMVPYLRKNDLNGAIQEAYTLIKPYTKVEPSVTHQVSEEGSVYKYLIALALLLFVAFIGFMVIRAQRIAQEQRYRDAERKRKEKERYDTITNSLFSSETLKTDFKTNHTVSKSIRPEQTDRSKSAVPYPYSRNRTVINNVPPTPPKATPIKRKETRSSSAAATSAAVTSSLFSDDSDRNSTSSSPTYSTSDNTGSFDGGGSTTDW
jgi:uncharacterized membrane protein YgcG